MFGKILRQDFVAAFAGSNPLFAVLFRNDAGQREAKARFIVPPGIQFRAPRAFFRNVELYPDLQDNRGNTLPDS